METSGLIDLGSNIFAGDFVQLSKSKLHESNYDYVSWVGVICLFRGLVAILGLSGNFGSIRTFLSMGLSDWLTVSLMWLAMADSVFLLAVIVISLAYFLAAFKQWCDSEFLFLADPFAIGIFFVNCGGGPYTLTMLITTFISVARCVMVVKPLTFRHAISRMRTVVILVMFSVFSVLRIIPILIFMYLKRRKDEMTNSTRFFLWLSSDRKQGKDILRPIRDAFLPLAVQVILLLCVYFMSRSLHESSQFRQGNTLHLNQLSVSAPRHTPRHTHDSLKTDELHGRNVHQISNQLKGKELKVILQMLLISSVFIICNTPKIVLNLVELSVPEFNIASGWQDLYYTMVNVRDLFQTVISSVNIMIYYKYNSKFRKHFHQIFFPTERR